MKKVISTVLAGAVMLSLSACSANSKTTDTGDASGVETTAVTTTEVTTATTTEETTTESSDETVTKETTKSFDEMIPSDGEVFVDFSGKFYTESAENIMKAIRIRTGCTAESYAKRFSVKPKYSYSKGVWTFTWGKNANDNTFQKITIKAKNDNNKIVLDDKSTISFVIYVENRDTGHAIHEEIGEQLSRDGDSDEYLKSGLAINPKRCNYRTTCFDRLTRTIYFVRVELTIECSVMAPAESE